MQVQKKTSEITQHVWRFDPEYSSIEFTVTKLFFFKVSGRFSKFSGAIVLDEEDLRRSSAVATLKADSIESGNSRRDAQLKTKGFLEVSKYPEIEFQSTKVTAGKDRDTFRVTGNLTINGKTKETTLEVNAIDRSRSPRGEEFVYYTASTELDRFDFGVNFGAAFIGRTLKVTINVQASRQV